MKRKIATIFSTPVSNTSFFNTKLRGSNKVPIRPTSVVFDDNIGPFGIGYGLYPIRGPENAAFCKEYKCNRLCFSKALGDHVCGKNGGQEIGKVHYKQCTHGQIWHAINILTGENKTFIGIDPAKDDAIDATSFIPMSRYKGTIIKDSIDPIVNWDTPA